MAYHPPYIRQPVLLLRLQFWKSPRPGPLSDVPRRGGLLRAQIPGPPQYRRVGTPTDDPGQGGSRHDFRGLLAIRIRHDSNYGPAAGTHALEPLDGEQTAAGWSSIVMSISRDCPLDISRGFRVCLYQLITVIIIVCDLIASASSLKEEGVARDVSLSLQGNQGV